MNPTMQIIFGALASAFGLFTLAMRFVSPNSPMFSKLEPMRRFWGPTLGTAIHWIGYTIVPIVVGAGMLLSGLKR
jgi:H+/Cl- antiporter ClcA